MVTDTSAGWWQRYTHIVVCASFPDEPGPQDTVMQGVAERRQTSDRS